MYQSAIVVEDDEIRVGLNVIIVINLESAVVVIVSVVNNGPIFIVCRVEQGYLVLARHKNYVACGGELVIIIIAALEAARLHVDIVDEVAVFIECRCTETAAESCIAPVAYACCHRDVATKPYLAIYR